MKRTVTILNLALILFCGSVANAAHLLVGFGEYKPPYVVGAEKRGLEIDIFREALAYRGHSMSVEHFPNKRLQRLLQYNHSIDGVATVTSSPEDGLYYVEDFIFFQNVVITKKKNMIQIEEVDDLEGLSIVAWQNAYRDLGPKYFELFKPDSQGLYRQGYIEHSSQKGQNAMFWDDRVVAIVVDENIFEWYRRLLGEQSGEQVMYHYIFKGQTTFAAAFRDEGLARDFADGLQHIKKTGLYDRLYDKYLISD